MTTCMPFELTSAAEVLTLKSPPPMLAEDQAKKLPLSKPSAKITSETAGVGEGVKVAVGVSVGPGVSVFVGVLLGVEVAVIVAVSVGVGEEPGVGVSVGVKVKVGVPVSVGVAVLVAVFVGVKVDVVVAVFVGMKVGIGPMDRKLNASTSFALCPQALPSK